MVAADWKKNEHMTEDMFCDEFHLVDCRVMDNCLKIVDGCDHVFNLAADMGGMGFIQSNHSVIMYNNTMISFNMLEAARIKDVKRFFYASSACVYPEYKQLDPENNGLKEADAWPAQPQVRSPLVDSNSNRYHCCCSFFFFVQPFLCFEMRMQSPATVTRMHMGWRSSHLRNCASTTTLTSLLSAVLLDSTTFMVHTEHGRVEERRPLLHSAERYEKSQALALDTLLPLILTCIFPLWSHAIAGHHQRPRV